MLNSLINWLALVSWQEVAAFLGVIAVAGPVSWWLYVKVRNGIRHFRTFKQELMGLIPRLVSMEQLIKTELTYNGGSSIKDNIRKMYEGQQRLFRSLAHLDIKLKYFADYYKALAWEFDSSGHCVWVSIGLADLVHKDTSQILGPNWMQIIVEEDRERVYAQRLRAIEQRSDNVTRYALLTSSGAQIPVMSEMRCIKDANGVVISHLGILTRIKNNENT